MVTARLDKKTREKVLCGKLDCGQLLAGIAVHKHQRHIMLESGWHQVAGGRWVVGQGALNRWRRDQQRAGNGDPNTAESQQAIQRLTSDKAFRNRRSLVRAGDLTNMYNRGDEAYQPFTTLALPTQMLCPACGSLNDLDPVSLDTESRPRTNRATPS